MNLSQAKPTSKQLNLNKLGDADGSQSHWLPTLLKTDFSYCLCISGFKMDIEFDEDPMV